MIVVEAPEVLHFTVEAEETGIDARKFQRGELPTGYLEWWLWGDNDPMLWGDGDEIQL